MHADPDYALKEVYGKVEKTLNQGGNIWIAEAGQSDFSAKLIVKIKESLKGLNTQKRINIVQHSDWNEKVTSIESLAFVKKHSTYHKIADGNQLDNGTPGFNTSDKIDYHSLVQNEEIKTIWDLATKLAKKYNGVENRYLNKSIQAGGMDFSDFSEVHYILKLLNMNTSLEFFNFIENNS